MIRERERATASGILALLLLLAVLVAAVVGIVLAAIALPEARHGESFWAWAKFIAALLVLIVDGVCFAGFFTVAPNEGQVLQLFGAYRGTAKQQGLRWANPFYTAKRISLRVRNFESARSKVNDTDGNPIEIASIVVWRVVDTAEAVFQVDDYENYVRVQTESAVRSLATRYPYDSHLEGEISLRGSTDEVARRLQKEIQERLAKAGVDVIEARISHLAYAPEIAAAMLRRQQAGAIIAARQKIVEGAVGMVDMALDLLAKSERVQLDEERKAAMVSNLLVVLCADREVAPVVNTGTIYQ